MYYEHDQVFCHESFDVTIHNITDVAGTEIGQQLLIKEPLFTGAHSPHRVGSDDISSKVPPIRNTISSFIDLNREYSKKELSYQSDALNAFSGILRWLESFEHPLYAIQGTPWVGPCDSLHDDSWYEAHVFVAGLAWKRTEKSVRRTDGHGRHLFPSWSWAAWRGQVTWLFNDLLQGDDQNGCESQVLIGNIAVGTEDGFIFRFNNFNEDIEGNNINTDFSTAEARLNLVRRLETATSLSFKARIVPSGMFSSSNEENILQIYFGNKDTFLSLSNYKGFISEQDSVDRMNDGRIACFWLSRTSSRFVLMVCECNEDGSYSRVGLMTIERDEAWQVIGSGRISDIRLV